MRNLHCSWIHLSFPCCFKACSGSGQSIIRYRAKIVSSRDAFNFVCFNLKRRDFSSKASHRTICIEKNQEDPVIVINEFDSVDIIGPPDKISNLRPIIRRNLINETLLQKKFRQMQDATQEWNQNFWSAHNTKFLKERQSYIMLHLKDTNDGQLTAEEMSQFYKKFLDENWGIHFKYNMEWYKKNFALFFLALQVSIEKISLKFL